MSGHDATAPARPALTQSRLAAEQESRFIKSLGPAGEPAPAFVPPGQETKGPYIQFPQPPK